MTHRVGKLTYKEVKARLDAVGVSISHDTIGVETPGAVDYRVTFSTSGRWPDMTEQSAEKSVVYTPDLEEALQIGLALARTRTTPGYRLLPNENAGHVARESVAADRLYQQDMEDMPGPNDPMWTKSKPKLKLV